MEVDAKLMKTIDELNAKLNHLKTELDDKVKELDAIKLATETVKPTKTSTDDVFATDQQQVTFDIGQSQSLGSAIPPKLEIKLSPRSLKQRTESSEIRRMPRKLNEGRSSASSRHFDSHYNNNDQVLVEWSSMLMSHYTSQGLFLRVRANRDVTETIELRWSAEVATQWTDYEFLEGTIEIQIGENVGTLDIATDQLHTYRATSSKKKQVDTATHKDGLLLFKKVQLL